MRKKIVFRKIDPSKYDGCQLMPLGSVEAEGRVTGGSGVTTGEISSWGRPTMEWRESLPSVNFPDIEVGLYAPDAKPKEFTLSLTIKNVNSSEVVKVLSGTAQDVPTATREKVLDECTAQLRPLVKSFVEETDRSLCFLGSFFLTLRLRLTDGTSFRLPVVKYMSVATEPLRVAILSIRELDGGVRVLCAFSIRPAALCMRVRNLGSFADRIAAVEYWATSPATVWNQSGEFSLVGSISPGYGSAGRLLTDGRLVEVDPSAPCPGLPSAPRGWVISGVSSPIAPQAPSGSVWHKIGETPGLSAGSDSWTPVRLDPSASLLSLFSGKGQSAEYSFVRVPSAAWVADIAGRSVAVRPRLSFPAPLLMPAFLPVGYDSEGKASGVRLTEMFVRMRSGEVLGQTFSAVTVAEPSAMLMPAWVYGVSGAELVAMVYRKSVQGGEEEGTIAFAMADDAVTDASVNVGTARELGTSELAALRRDAKPYPQVSVEEPSLLLDWNARDSFPLADLHRLSITGCLPAGVARVLPSTSTDLYPPIYLFGSDGVRLMRWNGSGGWRSYQMVSADRCVNPAGIVDCGDDIYFTTADGLCRLSGGVVTLLAVPGSGEDGDVLDRLPGSDVLVGRLPKPLDWASIMAGGELRYDLTSGLLVVIHAGEQYLYDTRRGRWVALGGSDPGADWLLTYPIDIGSARIYSLELFGCGLGEEVVVALYSSDTLGDWRLDRCGRTNRGRIGAIVGSQGRFRRLLTIGNRPEGAWLNL